MSVLPESSDCIHRSKLHSFVKIQVSVAASNIFSQCLLAVVDNQQFGPWVHCGCGPRGQGKAIRMQSV